MDEGRPLRLSRGILRCTGEAICTGATDYHTGIRATVASVDSVKSITRRRVPNLNDDESADASGPIA